MHKYFLILFLAIASYINAGEDHELFDQKTIENQVMAYFNTHNLEPYIPAGKGVATIEGCILHHIDDEDIAASIFQLGFDNQLKGMFIIALDNKTGGVQSKLLCLSDRPLISPTLFFDIMNSPMLYMSHRELITFRSDEGTHVFMTSDDGSIDQGQVYTWTFFTPDKSIEIPITLKSDGEGGTYFLMGIN